MPSSDLAATGFAIDGDDASLCLGWERALDVFDRRPPSDLRQGGRTVSATTTSLFGTQADPFFRALRMCVDGDTEAPFEPAFAVGVVLDGRGEVRGPQTVLPLERGVTFALPAAAVEGTRVNGDGLDLVWCLAPDPRALARP